jgi:hypothetical protein
MCLSPCPVYSRASTHPTPLSSRRVPPTRSLRLPLCGPPLGRSMSPLAGPRAAMYLLLLGCGGHAQTCTSPLASGELRSITPPMPQVPSRQLPPWPAPRTAAAASNGAAAPPAASSSALERDSLLLPPSSSAQIPATLAAAAAAAACVCVAAVIATAAHELPLPLLLPPMLLPQPPIGSQMPPRGPTPGPTPGPSPGPAGAQEKCIDCRFSMSLERWPSRGTLHTWGPVSEAPRPVHDSVSASFANSSDFQKSPLRTRRTLAVATCANS